MMTFTAVFSFVSLKFCIATIVKYVQLLVDYLFSNMLTFILVLIILFLKRSVGNVENVYNYEQDNLFFNSKDVAVNSLSLSGYDCSNIISKKTYDASNVQNCENVQKWYPESFDTFVQGMDLNNKKFYFIILL